MMECKHVKMERRNHVAIITINNPDKMNSMDMQFVYDIQGLLDICERDTEIRCAVLTGAGDKAFTAGGDIKMERNLLAEELRELNDQGNAIIKMIMGSRMPYIAAVNGYALGAAIGLIAACDIVIAAEHAVFGNPTPSLGGVPGWGSIQLAARIIGPQNIKMFLLANEKCSAAEAHRMGLVNKVVKRGELMEMVMNYANTMASFAPNAIRAAKYAVNKGLEVTLEEGLRIEAEMIDCCNSEYNFKEGITAFLEKRTANYKMM